METGKGALNDILESISPRSTPISTPRASLNREDDIPDPLYGTPRPIEEWSFQASSTPLQDYEANEETPLLQRRKHSRKRWYWALLLLLLPLLFVRVPDLDSVVTSDLQSFAVLGLTPRGANVHIVGSLSMNYDKIDNWFQRGFVKTAALAIGGITVVPQNATRVHLSGPGIRRTHAVDVFPPEVPVDLINRRVTQVDFITETVFQSRLPQFAEDLLKQGGPTQLDVQVSGTFKLASRWLHYTTNATFAQTLELLPKDTDLPFVVRDIEVDTKKHLSVNMSVLLDKRLPVSLDVARIEWDVAIPDCDGKPVLLGYWDSQPFSIAPNSPLLFVVNGLVKSIPESLTKKCAGGMSALNAFLSQMVNEHTLRAWVSARASQHNRDVLFGWLYQTITSVRKELNLAVPRTEAPSVLAVGFSNTSIVIPSLWNSLKAMVSGQLSASLELKNMRNVHFDLSNVHASAYAKEKGSKFALLQTLRKDAVSVFADNGTTRMVSWFSNEVKVSDAHRVGKLLNRWLNGAPALLDVDVFVAHMELSLPIVKTTIQDLSLKGIHIESFAAQSGFVDWFLSNMDLAVMLLYHTSSLSDSIKLTAEVELTNPMPLSLAFPDDTLSVQLTVNDTFIGSASISDFVLPQTSERLSYTASVVIDCLTVLLRLEAERFLSLVVSGADDISMAVKGTHRSLAINPQLGAVLLEISVPLTFPHLSFRLPQETSEKEPKGSPFLVDALIHLLTSEIELTVFNPLANVNLAVRLLLCRATYKGTVLAYVDQQVMLDVPPGIVHTPKIPIRIARGVGADILRKAVNGELSVHVEANMDVVVGQFGAQILYSGDGVTAKVKL